MRNLSVWLECYPNDRAIKLARLTARGSKQSVQLQKIEILSSQCLTLITLSIRIKKDKAVPGQALRALEG
jgi:hypothetical protein